jgi:hypothetical protein
MLKGSPVHVAPVCAGSREESDHFGSYVCSLSLHFSKRLFPGHEPMTTWSQGNSFTAAPGLPFNASMLLGNILISVISPNSRTGNRLAWI